jgi:hypothetical protein
MQQQFRKTRDKFKKYPNYELSEWEANEKVMTYTSFPFLEFNKEKGTKRVNNLKIKSSLSNFLEKSSSSSLPKANMNKGKTSVANAINLSFNP